MKIPIVSYPGNDGGYSILDDYFIPPVTFNRDEVLSLLLAKKAMDIISIPGYSRHVNSAFLKIGSNIGEALKDELNDIEKRVMFDIKNIELDKNDLKFFNLIKNSLEKHLKLKIQYFSAKRLNSMERIIRPYGLIYEEGIWFLIAYCEFNKEIVSFRADRVRDAEILDEKFEVPGDFDVEKFNCRINYLNDHLNPESENVKLRLSKSLYYSIKDYAFLKFADAVEYEDCFILNVKTTNPDRYVYIAFEYFNGMEIMEPEYLRKDFIQRLEKLYGKYIKSW